MYLIACDLDRTLIPNGREKDDGALSSFYEQTKGNTLVYVSGRNLALLNQAKDEFNLQCPDYFIGAVGTAVYKNENGGLVTYPSWKSYLQNKHPRWDRHTIIERMPNNSDIFPQEIETQNDYKVSYYIENQSERDTYIAKAEEVVEGMEAEVVYSHDPHKDLGLLDILPRYATKKGALEFLIDVLHFPREQVVFAGDSGNDLLVLTSGIKSILVNNASPQVKDKALSIAHKNGVEDKLYIAQGDRFGNGNYASGVLEGLRHFGVL